MLYLDHLLFLLLLFLSFSFFTSVTTSGTTCPLTPPPLLFAQSCALTGPSSRLGTEMRLGVLSAFESVNAKGGILHGQMLSLISLDDGYEPGPCVENTVSFVNGSMGDIFGLVGYVGTPTSLAARDIIRNASETYSTQPVPYIGPFTGARFLRSDQAQYPTFVNIRASYDDEVQAMVHYLIRKRNIFQISLLKQNDSFGDAGEDALLRALSPYEIEVGSVGIFDRNTGAGIAEAVEIIGASSPPARAVIMIGTYGPLAEFVAEYVNFTRGVQQRIIPNDVVFLSVSFVGSRAFSEELVLRHNVDLNTTEVIITQVVPHYNDIKTYPSLISKYREALSLVNQTAEPSFISLEGYLVGRFVVKALQGTYGNVSREAFLESVFLENRRFLLDEFEIGTYEMANASESSGESGCNQGLNTIWPTRVVGAGQFEIVQDAVFSWGMEMAQSESLGEPSSASCISDPTMSKPHLLFAQSAAFSGVSSELGVNLQAGLDAALFAYNRQQELDRRILRLYSLDDGYEPDACLNNTRKFIQDPRTFALLGYVGTPTSKRVKDDVILSGLPYIGAFTGANLLRDPGLTNIINVRSGYDEEISAQVQLFLDMSLTKFAIFYQNDSFGLAGLSGLNKTMGYVGLSIVAMSTYERNTVNETTLRQSALEILADDPDVIVCVGTYAPLALFVEIYKNLTNCVGDSSPSCPYFSTVSFVGSRAFRDALEHREHVYISQVVPHYDDVSMQIVREFHEDLALLDGLLPSFVSLEGYVVGRLVTAVMSSFPDAEMETLTSDEFVQRVYEMQTIQIGELVLGPYANQTIGNLEQCNSGLRKVWLTNLTDDGFSVVKTFSFQTCRADIAAVKRPGLLGQSIDLLDPRWKDFSDAIQLGLGSLDETSSDRMLLIPRNDNGLQSTLLENIAEFDAFEAVAHAGMLRSVYLGSENYLIVGTLDPVFGSHLNPNVVNVRPYVFDEVFSAVKYYSSSVVAIVVPSGQYPELSKLNQHASIVDSDHASVVDGLNSIGADVLLCLCSLSRFETIVDDLLVLGSSPTLVFFSHHDDAEIAIPAFANHVKFRFFSKESALYNNFMSDTDFAYSDHAYHGYLVGRLLSESWESHALTGYSLGDALFHMSVFSFDDEIVGPFESDCSIGTRETYLYSQDNVRLSSFSWMSCTQYSDSLSTCYEVPYDDPEVCSGSGVCTSQDVCNCTTLHVFGLQCAELIRPPLWHRKEDLLVVRYEVPSAMVMNLRSESNCTDIFRTVGVLGATPRCRWAFGFHKTSELHVFLDADHQIDEGVLLEIFVQTGRPGDYAVVPVERHSEALSAGIIAAAVLLPLFFIAVLVGVVVLVLILWIVLSQRKLKELRERQDRFEALNLDEIVLEEEMRTALSVPRVAIDKKLCRIPYRELELVRVLAKGGGNASSIFLAKWQGIEVAYKSYRGMNFGDEVIYEEFEKEVHLLSSLRSPNVLTFYGHVAQKGKAGIVLEYCPKGDLSDFIAEARIEKKKPIDLGLKFRILEGVVSGMQYLHSKDVVHRDLKLKNVLLGSDMTPKLIDFGLSTFIESSDSDSQHRTKRVGTSVYMSPEIVLGHVYTPKIDVFSFGILMFGLLAETVHPYGKQSDLGIELRVANNPKYRPEIPEYISKNPDLDGTLVLLKKCWDADPAQRPTFSELMVDLGDERRKYVESLSGDREMLRGSVVFEKLRLDAEMGEAVIDLPEDGDPDAAAADGAISTPPQEESDEAQKVAPDVPIRRSRLTPVVVPVVVVPEDGFSTDQVPQESPNDED